MLKYVLAVDQSTQGTKGLLFDENGKLVARRDRAHQQIVNDRGWVEHNPKEILNNTLAVCRDVIEEAGIEPDAVCAMGISNQRETSLAWNRQTGEPIYNAIVWQCSRAVEICRRHEAEARSIQEKTGLQLSPYFPASKLQWIMENVPEAQTLKETDSLAVGTIDTWLVYSLTKDHAFKTDYSNASRTQLFNIGTLAWDPELLNSFGLPASAMAKVCMSDSVFGMTDLGELLPREIPICGVLGDSHGALFGQDCRQPGQIKATYGTGSSVMMNTGEERFSSDKGIVTSLAWGMHGKVKYVLEGNLNYTGAVISWLKDNAELIASAKETGDLAKAANPLDKAYFIPAFTGLGAPYWDSEATGMLTGITRTTGKKEIVKACVECIGYQITDLVQLMRQETGRKVAELRVDGGPTGNDYLMQFQSDIADVMISIPEIQELSGMGAAYAAGIAAGIYNEEELFAQAKRTQYTPQMLENVRRNKYIGWQQAVQQVLTH
jgi:glycerol kinase